MVQPKKNQYNPSHQQTEKGTQEGSGGVIAPVSPFPTTLLRDNPSPSDPTERGSNSPALNLSPLNPAELRDDGSGGLVSELEPGNLRALRVDRHSCGQEEKCWGGCSSSRFLWSTGELPSSPLTLIKADTQRPPSQ